MKVKLLSRVRLLATPWTAAYQAPPSMGFSRQEYWSGVPLPSPLKSLYLSYFHFHYPPLAGSFLASLKAVGDSCPVLTHDSSAASDPQTVRARLEFPSPKSQRPPAVTSPWGSAATWDGAHKPGVETMQDAPRTLASLPCCPASALA